MKSKIVTLLLSAVIAFGLWVYVVTVVSPESEETYYNVPVVLEGQSSLDERNLMIVSNKDFKVNLTLSGYRTDLNKLDSSNITVLADLSVITEPGVHQLNYSISYPGTLGQTGSIHTVEKDPQQIQLTVVERSRKDIPVRVSYKNNLPENYTTDRQNISLDHSTVTVIGPKDVIDRIDHARIEIDLEGRTHTINEAFRHTLCDKNGDPVEDVSTVTVNVSDIKANLVIQQMKELPVFWSVQGGGGLTADMVTVTPDQTSIVVSGSEASLRDLVMLNYGTIDLSRLFAQPSEIAKGFVELTYDISLPEDVNNVTGVTTITLKVELKEEYRSQLEIRPCKVVNITWKNAPAGADVTVLTQSLSVTVRGTTQQLDLLLKDDPLGQESIRAEIDLSEAGEGIYTYTATIIIEAEGVGAVGEYKVSVAVTLPEAG